MDEIAENSIEILVNEMAVMADNLSNPLRIHDESTKIQGTAFNVIETSSIDSRLPITEGNELKYTVKIKNTTGNTINNITATKILPKVLEYKEAYIQQYNEITRKWENKVQGNYDNSTRTVMWNINSLESGAEARVVCKSTVGVLGENEYEQEIEGITEVRAEGHVASASVGAKNTVAFPHLEAKIVGNASKEYISEGDEIIYTIDVKNSGSMAASNVKFKDVLPGELKFVEANYISSKKQKKTNITEHNNSASFITNILPNENIKISIRAKAKDLPNYVEEATIVNYATFAAENTESIVTEQVKTRVEQNPYKNNLVAASNNNGDGSQIANQNGIVNGNNNGNIATNNVVNQNEKTFRVRGTVWVDANLNGSRDSGEQLLSGVSVVLANATTKQIIKDQTSGLEKTTTTANDGTYVFENLASGDYIVMFYYNTEMYALTDYRKSGVDESKNSDVISQKVFIGGQNRTAGISDTIRLQTNSYANIDMGLVTSKKFDLKLDKVITKVTVQNKEGVKSFNYSDTKLAKVDITGKELVGSTIVVEYKIRIANEGNVPGYAKSIIDYLPKDLRFNSNLNPNWYVGRDGGLFNTSLTNQIINPGQTKELTLYLTKQMVDATSVIQNNQAEIYEHYNELGLSDIDSTPNNKASNEDDLSSADLIITIKTGAVVGYSVSTIIILIIVAAGIYILRKRNARYYN